MGTNQAIILENLYIYIYILMLQEEWKKPGVVGKKLKCPFGIMELGIMEGTNMMWSIGL